MAMANPKAFFDGVKRVTGGLEQPQVDGINLILAEWEKRGLTEPTWLAYMLATAWHETAHSLQPVIETYNAANDKGVNPSLETAIARLDHAFATGRLKWVKTPYWRKDANGQSWLGRGFVQLTFKTNYQNAQNKTGLPLVAHPEMMLESAPACRVMFDGMIGGWFTSKKLSDYLGNGKHDFVNARRIINGLDRADDIAGYAHTFEEAIAAGRGAPK